MGFERYFERIARIDRLIKLKSTGSPKEFAQKVGISKTWLYEYLNYFKSKGCKISLNKERNTLYCFEIKKVITHIQNRLVDDMPAIVKESTKIEKLSLCEL